MKTFAKRAPTCFGRVSGVFAISWRPMGGENEELAQWLVSHPVCFQEALDAVGSIYAEETARELSRIRRALDDADAQRANQGTLSQKAIRALRSTAGVSVVLVGMRDDAYWKMF